MSPPAEIAEVDAMLDRVQRRRRRLFAGEHTYIICWPGAAGPDRHGLVRVDGRIVGYAFVSAGDDPVAGVPRRPGPHAVRGSARGCLRRSSTPGGRGCASGRTVSCRPPSHRDVRRGCALCARLCHTRALTWLPGRRIAGRGDSTPVHDRRCARRGSALNAEAFVDLPGSGLLDRADLDVSGSVQRGSIRRVPAPRSTITDSWVSTGRRSTAGDASARYGPGRSMCLAVAGRARTRALGSRADRQDCTTRGFGPGRTVMLYVDLQNTGAVAMCRKALGFVRADGDVQFALAPG